MVIKNVCKWSAVAAVAAALVGCGAAAEDGSEEAGQTEEPLTVFMTGDGRSWGVDREPGGSLSACRLNGPNTQDCVWIDPYQYPPLGVTAPARYRIYVNTAFIHQSGNLVTMLNQIVTGFNGEMAGAATLELTTHVPSGVFIDFEGHDGVSTAPVGDLRVEDYIVVNYTGFGAVRSECVIPTNVPCPTPVPGTYRSTKIVTVGIDIDRLQANFPQSQFAGNLKQAAAHVVLLALGIGEQLSFSPAYSNLGFSAAVQATSLNRIMMGSEHLALDKLARTSTSDTDAFINLSN